MPDDRPHHQELIDHARSVAADVDGALIFAIRRADAFPLPGRGSTRERWELLASVAGVDLTVARVLEPHLDALAILDEAGHVAPSDVTWGVYAAEAPGSALTAHQTPSGWLLDGVKPWCSLAARLDRALVTATQSDGERRLFAVELTAPGVTVEPAGWIARGLPAIHSGPVSFVAVDAEPVGDPGWYLSRPGFAWGGIGVAACWWGAALAHRDALAKVLAEASATDLRLYNLGSADAQLFAAETAFDHAARQIDEGRDTDTELLAQRVRAIVATAAEATLTAVGHALGPRLLAFDEVYARRDADLRLYLAQHHAERDLAALGRRLTHPR